VCVQQRVMVDDMNAVSPRSLNHIARVGCPLIVSTDLDIIILQHSERGGLPLMGRVYPPGPIPPGTGCESHRPASTPGPCGASHPVPGRGPAAPAVPVDCGSRATTMITTSPHRARTLGWLQRWRLPGPDMAYTLPCAIRTKGACGPFMPPRSALRCRRWWRAGRSVRSSRARAGNCGIRSVRIPCRS